MIKCEHCGTENDDRNYYCGWCGNLIKEMLVSKKYTEKYNISGLFFV
ncbi:MAG: zinc-ribbon domain-containing protein [Lachnospiraceae bacterium]|nr:zinc-ribbon domain-containing protein [Lachnospiraceae bacterium]